MNFFKLVIKTGLKFPGDYIEAVSALVIGYVYPLNLPAYVNGTSKVYIVQVADPYPQLENRQGTTLFDKVFGNLYRYSNGRMMYSVLGWAFRTTLYVWVYLFAPFYCLYRKNKKGLLLLLIPFCYMLTIFLGPVSWLRYMFIQIATIPLAAYAMLTGQKGISS